MNLRVEKWRRTDFTLSKLDVTVYKANDFSLAEDQYDSTSNFAVFKNPKYSFSYQFAKYVQKPYHRNQSRLSLTEDVQNCSLTSLESRSLKFLGNHYVPNVVTQ